MHKIEIILIYYNTNNKKMTETEQILPRRLVMIKYVDNCMFCKDPRGEVYAFTACYSENLGFITCITCKDKGEKAVNDWSDIITNGKVGYLKDKKIKITRSGGHIEAGWEIDSPVTSNDGYGGILIHCYNNEQQLGRWCNIDDIIKLNPLEENK